VVFTARSPAARDAVIAQIAVILEESQRKHREPVFRMLNQWDEWERVDDLPPRSLGSVILPPGQLERVTGDIEGFLAAEASYARRSAPWHRGHLYEGPPGTGKTSIARAVADHFKLDMWYLSLAGIKSDTNLIKTVMAVKGRSILLLEDIDVFHAARERDGFGGTTLSGLLNALDGLTTPHGLITVMTSNEPEKLDPALVRAGRIDLREHFGLCGEGEVLRLLAHWYDMSKEEVAEIMPGISAISPADVIEACKRSPSAGDAVKMLIRHEIAR
jgi:ATP-dependent 26S proteasome regulatory subunit